MFFEVKDKEMLREAMKELCAFLDEHGVPSDRVFDSRLVACELLGNVLRHADGMARLYSDIKDGFVELKIISENLFRVPDSPLCSDVFSEHGRGLYLVKQVCKEEIFSEKEGVRVRIRIEEENK